MTSRNTRKYTSAAHPSVVAHERRPMAPLRKRQSRPMYILGRRRGQASKTNGKMTKSMRINLENEVAMPIKISENDKKVEFFLGFILQKMNNALCETQTVMFYRIRITSVTQLGRRHGYPSPYRRGIARYLHGFASCSPTHPPVYQLRLRYDAYFFFDSIPLSSHSSNNVIATTPHPYLGEA